MTQNKTSKILPVSNLDTGLPHQKRTPNAKSPDGSEDKIESLDDLFQGYHLGEQSGQKKSTFRRVVAFFKNVCHRCWSVTVLLPTVLVLQILITAGVVFALTYVNSLNSVHSVSVQLVTEVNGNINNRVRELLRTPATIIGIQEIEMAKHHVTVTNHPLSGNFTEESYSESAGYFLSLLDSYPSTALVYACNDYGDIIGYERGEDNYFNWVKYSYGDEIYIDLTTYSMDELCHIKKHNLTIYPTYVNGTNIPGRKPSIACSWDARARPWYNATRENPDSIRFSLPYVYPNGDLGITVSKSVFSQIDSAFVGVGAVDFKLDSLARFLQTITVGRTGRSFLMTKSGDFLASNNPNSLIPEGDTSVVYVDLVKVVNVPDRKVSDAGKAMLNKYRSYDQIFTGEELDSMSAYKEWDGNVDGEDSFIYVSNLNYDENIDWIIVVVLPKADFLSNVYTANIITISTCAAFVFLSIIVALLLTGLIIFPLFSLGRSMKQAQLMVLTDKKSVLPVLYEVAQIKKTFSSLVKALRFFKKFIPSSIIKRVMMEDETSVTKITESDNITLMFIDIVGFSTFSERLPPGKLLQLMSAALDQMSELVISHGGVIDSFIGDAIFALYGVPGVNDDPYHATHAVISALKCVERLKELDDAWKEFGVDPLRIRVGVNTGEAFVGVYGSRQKVSFSCMGNSVNTASRLEPMNKQYGSTILISEHTHKQVKGDIVCRTVDRVIAKGLSIPMNVYEPLCVRDSHSPDNYLHIEELSSKIFRALQEKKFEECFKSLDMTKEIPGFEEDEVFQTIRKKVEDVRDGKREIITKLTSK